ncbi:MAG: hypothetical protein HQM12_14655 [SAR324 cluster bacterium]|nr:hypothetical protein [SAR324 cluster bacterium]
MKFLFNSIVIKNFGVFFLGILVGGFLHNNYHQLDKLGRYYERMNQFLTEYRENRVRDRLKKSLISQQQLTHPELFNPGDIIWFQGKFVATELMHNQLAIFDDLQFTNLRHFDPQSIGQKFYNPHFMAISPWNTLLLSDGWGSAIVEIKDLEGNGWKTFDGPDHSMHGPHGICVAQDGWIYVADSKKSRIVRFRDMDGKDWQVFADHQHKISYARQLICDEDGIWIANSYENLPGLNQGQGANILKISNFESGMTEEIFSLPYTNITGMLRIGNQFIWGEWIMGQRLVTGQLGHHITLELVPAQSLGVPYGMRFFPEQNLWLGTYFGSWDWQKDKGGLLSMKID